MQLNEITRLAEHLQANIVACGLEWVCVGIYGDKVVEIQAKVLYERMKAAI